MSWVEDAVDAEARRAQAIIERACEAALTTEPAGVGVRVVRRGALLVSAEPDPSVPYGRMHVHQEWPLAAARIVLPENPFAPRLDELG